MPYCVFLLTKQFHTLLSNRETYFYCSLVYIEIFFEDKELTFKLWRFVNNTTTHAQVQKGKQQENL